jgi:hypothetical protein
MARCAFGVCSLEKAPAYRMAEPACSQVGRTAQKTANSIAALCFLFAIAFTPFASSAEERFAAFFFAVVLAIGSYMGGYILRRILELSGKLCETIRIRSVRLLASLANEVLGRRVQTLEKCLVEQSRLLKQAAAAWRARSAIGAIPSIASTVSTLRSGTSRSTRSTAGMTPKDFWWQWPCRRTARAAGPNGNESRLASASAARNSSNVKVCSASCWAMSLLSILGISSRNPKMQLEIALSVPKPICAGPSLRSTGTPMRPPKTSAPRRSSCKPRSTAPTASARLAHELADLKRRQAEEPGRASGSTIRRRHTADRREEQIHDKVVPTASVP